VGWIFQQADQSFLSIFRLAVFLIGRLGVLLFAGILLLVRRSWRRGALLRAIESAPRSARPTRVKSAWPGTVTAPVESAWARSTKATHSFGSGAGATEAAAKTALAKAAASLRHGAGAAAKTALAKAAASLRHSAGATAKTALAWSGTAHRHSAARSKTVLISRHGALLTKAAAEALLAAAKSLRTHTAAEATLTEAARSGGHAALRAETAAKAVTTKTAGPGSGWAPTAAPAATAPTWLVVTPTATTPRWLPAARAAPTSERLSRPSETAAPPGRRAASGHFWTASTFRPTPLDLADDLIRGHGGGAVVAVGKLSQRRQGRPADGHQRRTRAVAHRVVPVGHLFAQHFDPGLQCRIRLGRRPFTLAALFLRRLFLLALAGGLRPGHGNRQ
jgi:hypothetical protein